MVDPIRRAQSALTDRLRRSRRDAGLTGAAMAERLGAGWGQPKVSKIESGRQLPTLDDLNAWAQVTGVDPAELAALLDRASHEFSTFRDAYPQQGGPTQHQATHADAERRARRIFAYEPTVVPALLQTPEYARALLALPGGPADHGATQDQIDLMIAERLRRASILFEPARDITVLVGEAALRNRVGSADIMAAQADHIRRLADSTPTPTSASSASRPAQSFPSTVGNSSTTSSASKPPQENSKSPTPKKSPNMSAGVNS